MIAALPGMSAGVSLGVVVASRLAAGLGESQFITGCVSWSIASVGPQRAGMSMSWTGIAMFAALAVGAPVGMALYHQWGLPAAMIACVIAPMLAIVVAVGATPYVSPMGHRLPFHRVIGQIWREGLSLMLQGVGLSGLTAFASLYFVARGWTHAGLVMTAFGAGFIFIRVVLGHFPDRIGGLRVAFWSLVIEAIGQAMLWRASQEWVALSGALVTGLGCALIFPALGVEALKRVLPANRGSAMGGFVAFMDIAYGLTGPGAGLIAGQFGYAAVYLLVPLVRCLARLSLSLTAPPQLDCHIATFPRRTHMSRIFISGSSTGLGLMAAELLVQQGHQVVCMPATLRGLKTHASRYPEPRLWSRATSTPLQGPRRSRHVSTSSVASTR